MMQTQSLLAGLLLVSTAVVGEDAPFRGPMLGQIFDREAQMIRPIVGTPGAALVAPALGSFRFQNAAVADDGSVALASNSGQQHILWFRPAQPDREPIPIPDSLAAFDLAAFSPDSANAVLYQETCNCVQVLSSLANEPKVTRTVSLPEGVTLRALAVANDASVFAVADTSGNVRLYRPDSDILLGLPASALAFREDNQAFAAIDEARKTVALVTRLAETPEIVEIASEHDGLRSPSAIAFRDSETLIVADKDAGVHLVQATGGVSGTISCACQPSAVHKIALADVYRVTAISSGAVWILRLQEDKAESMFIPVGNE